MAAVYETLEIAYMVAVDINYKICARLPCMRL